MALERTTEFLRANQSRLGGVALSLGDAATAPNDALRELVAPWAGLLLQFPLVGMTTGYQSSIWIPYVVMDLRGVWSELTEVYPGLLLREAGWVPIALDATGSGDPLCVRPSQLDEAPVIVAYHDEAHSLDSLLTRGLRTVASSFIALLENAWSREGSA